METQSPQYSNRPIGVFDSGIGGLSVANAIIGRLPGESLCYFGDNARLPYGTKPQETIREYCREITTFLLEEDCKLIVVACNTATAAALEHLRQTWPDVPFVGMEPAVKPGAKATRTGKVGVLATRGTFSSPRYADLMHRFAKEIEVFEDPCPGLVELIEAQNSHSTEIESLLRSVLTPMLDRQVDTLVLGCTHYPFVKAAIEKIAGSTVHIIDPAPAVAKQVEHLLHTLQLHHAGEKTDHRLYTSGNLPAFRKKADTFFLSGYRLQSKRFQ